MSTDSSQTDAGLKSAPTLFSLNGFGLRLYGQRDADSETRTHIATRFVSLLYIPVLGIDAYRVTTKEGGQYFTGRATLSAVVKVWNLAVLGTVLAGSAGVYWYNYSQSHDYIARTQLRHATGAYTERNYVEASALYATVANGPAQDYRPDAMAGLRAVLTPEVLGGLPRAQAARLLRSATPACRPVDCSGDFPSLYRDVDRMLSQPSPTDSKNGDQNDGKNDGRNDGKNDPKGALALWEAVQKFAPDEKAFQQRHRALLETVVAQEINDKINDRTADPKYAIQLALAYEGESRFDDCERILAPFADVLGATEGARLLGQIYVAQNQINQAYALLKPYTTQGLAAYRQAEESYDQAWDQLWDQMIKDLNDGKGPDSFYDAYEKADDAGKDKLLNEHYSMLSEQSPQIAARLSAYRDKARVVPVALDFGIVTLRRAQGIADAGERKQELENAEALFLDIKGAAGDSDKYRLYLGQVYYWLGKQDQGKTLFDELIAANDRHYVTLYEVSGVLRTLGDITTSYGYAKEAYEAAADDADKQGIALYLSKFGDSTEERIEWLEKANLDSAHVQAELSNLKGQHAEGNNDLDGAIAHYLEAIRAYGELPESSATLNNSALVYFSLSELTGNPEHWAGGVERMDGAIALEPDDSIILLNASSKLIEGAYRRVVLPHMDLRTLKVAADYQMLSYLYADAEGKARFQEELRKDPAVTKALSYLDTAMVLAPKNASVFAHAYGLNWFLQDNKALAALLERLRQTDLDQQEYRDSVMRLLDPETAEDYRVSYGAQEKRYRALASEVGSQNNPKLEKLTAVYASSIALAAQVEGSRFDLEANPDDAVELAQANYQTAPSSGTRGDLINAVAFRLVRSLAAEHEDFAALVKAHQRTHPYRTMVGVALEQSALRNRVSQHRDFKTLARFVIEQNRAFPNTLRGRDWAILRHTDASLAAQWSKAALENTRNPLSQGIQEILYPLNPAVIYGHYWLKSMAGQPEAGLDFVQAYLKYPGLITVPRGP